MFQIGMSPFIFLGENMNYKELKARMVGLGFSDEAEVKEYVESGLIASSLNQALKTLSDTVKGVNDTITHKVDKIGIVKLSELVSGYDELLEIRDGNGNTVNDYELFEDGTVFMKRTGEYLFIYRKRVPLITKNTADDYELPVAYECEAMLPLLTAYYVWLDDDMEIATRWYNEYDSLKQAYLEKKNNKPLKARIRVDMSYMEF